MYTSLWHSWKTLNGHEIQNCTLKSDLNGDFDQGSKGPPPPRNHFLTIATEYAYEWRWWANEKVAVDSTLASSMEITPQLKREQLESYYQRRFLYYQKNHWVAVYPVSLLSSALTVHLTNKLGLLLLNYCVLLKQQAFSLRGDRKFGNKLQEPSPKIIVRVFCTNSCAKK